MQGMSGIFFNQDIPVQAQRSTNAFMIDSTEKLFENTIGQFFQSTS